MLELIEGVWYGTESSFYQALAAERAIAARLQAGPFTDEVDDTYLLSKVGNTGVVAIRGPLVNIDHPILAFFGVSSYPAIRRAMVAAAKDPEIKQILLSVDSGGGAVNGVADTADLIKRVNDKVKPVSTMADGAMASAAYWLGVSGAKVHAGKTSMVGSIGVLAMHIDRTKQLEQDGIKVTVMRAGKYKALLNPFETATEEALKEEQNKLDAAYRLFVQHVADSRRVSYDEADRRMAQGREFFGAAALDAGLVDSITTLDAVLSKLAGGQSVDSRAGVYDNGINSGASMKIKPAALTEQEIAALASGANLDAKAGEEPVAPAAPEAPAAPAAETPAAPAAASTETVVETPAPAPAADAVVELLKAQIKEKDEKIVAQALELKSANEKLATVETTHEGLLVIARRSVGHMRVALGGSAGDADSLPAAQLLAEHKRLADEFQKKFKVGGVAAAAPAVEESKAAAVPALHAARIAAVKIKK